MEPDITGLKEKYLLGELSEEQMTWVEEQYFEDDGSFEELLALEEDLIDRYVRNDLPDERRQHFEEAFLANPERRQRVELARALLRVAAEKKRAPIWGNLRALFSTFGPATKYSLATAAVGALVAFVALGFIAMTLKQRLATARVELARLQTLQGVASFVLAPGVFRGTEGPQRLVLPPETLQVEIRLDVSGEIDYQFYCAAVLTLTERQIWAKDGLTAQTADGGRSVVLKLPAGLLRMDDYMINLDGLTVDGTRKFVATYQFAVGSP